MNEPDDRSNKRKGGCRAVQRVLLYIGLVLLVGHMFRAAVADLATLPEAIRSTEWPSISGKVTVSESVFSPGVVDDVPDTTEDLIVYTYRVNDQTYSGDRFSFGYARLPDGLRTMDERLAQFPVETTVTVYYDPTDPANAVLFPGNRYSLLDFLVSALSVIFTGAVFAALVGLPLSRLVGGFREKRLAAQTPSDDLSPAHFGKDARP